ncbi:MAG: hypothetical protein WD355_03725 [Balneolaceae bacterium]
MKIQLSLILLFIFGGTSTAIAQSAGDAADVDPNHHNVIFENDHVRIYEALASPGARSPMHTHPPRMFIHLTKARFRMTETDGSSMIVDINPSEISWLDSGEHSWELLAGELHGIGIEIKSAVQAGDPAGDTSEDPNDAVSVDPTHYNVIMNNEHVRVFEALASPGAGSAMHTHPPTVMVSLEKSRFRTTDSDGSSMISDLNPAQVFWMDGATHSWETLAGQMHLVGVEVKSAR